MNKFCHISVLYAEFLPSELSNGMLGNKVYQKQNSHLLEQWIINKLQAAGKISPGAWYSLARVLMKADESAVKSSFEIGGSVAKTFVDILRADILGFEEIWTKTQPRLEERMKRFVDLWAPISDQVLTRLSELAKTNWIQDEILVHFMDCLYGGFAWVDTIAFTTLSDLEVQKKFLAHELSELITPGSIVESRLGQAGLNREIVHTVVDMLAYFSIREFLAQPVYPHAERRGIKPNPSYYPAVEELFPLFENYSRDPSAYSNFDTLAQEIITRLKASRPISLE